MRQAGTGAQIRLVLRGITGHMPSTSTTTHNGGHSARHEQVARQIPWPASSPFCGSLLVAGVGCPD
jgi:hypothetical protein